MNISIYLFASKYILIAGFKMHSDGNVFKITGVCFKVNDNSESFFNCQTQYFRDKNLS